MTCAGRLEQQLQQTLTDLSERESRIGRVEAELAAKRDELERKYAAQIAEVSDVT
jgi:septal ring factor EnvC (AmiA/AmiB activator)